MLYEESTVGSIFKALFDNNGNPSLSEVMAFLAYFAAIILGIHWEASTSPVTREV